MPCGGGGGGICASACWGVRMGIGSEVKLLL